MLAIVEADNSVHTPARVNDFEVVFLIIFVLGLVMTRDHLEVIRRRTARLVAAGLTARAVTYAASEGISTLVIERFAPGGQAGASARIGARSVAGSSPE